MIVPQETMQFKRVHEDIQTPRQILLHVYRSLEEKGYDPISQIVGYLNSGDPTFITSYNDARSLISRLEKDELIEELVSFYMTKNA